MPNLVSVELVRCRPAELIPALGGQPLLEVPEDRGEAAGLLARTRKASPHPATRHYKPDQSLICSCDAVADGFGPWVAATSYDPEPDWVAHPNRELADIAEQFGPDHRAPAATVIEQATREFPDFDDSMMALCR
ncbi:MULTISPECIES: hypothetical protein [unclassified Streptomyces]|uniref:hypothetical protein n=1 Tax=unclassified Streptomyces TaxID=2593676 RepID=UPI0037FFF470